MKKLLPLLLICLLCLGFASCGKDDEPIVEEKFTWNGDWNNPTDPNYKPEGYNPIEGKWISDIPKLKYQYYIRYTKDFNIIDSAYYEDEGIWKVRIQNINGGYIINNSSFRYIFRLGADLRTEEYKLLEKGSVLEKRIVEPFDNWYRFKRYTDK